MTFWLIILAILYLAMLAFLSLRSRSKNKSVDDFMLGGSNIGLLLGFMTFSATLFSTFTLMGMPDFFRNHGVGAWIFLALSDAGMVFLIVWFGFHIRNKVTEKGFRGVAGLLINCYKSKWAGYVYFIGIFLFLIPYVAIQIRGISIFLQAAFPEFLPSWGWATAIVGVMLLYSETGGLKAIMFADVMQGIMLMIVVWIIAVVCINYFGGVGAMFEEVEVANTALLSTPGPQGLFTVQFLVASFLVILLLPVTQPQFTTRIIIMRDIRSTHLMAVAVGIFAILVILPTIPIGLYGAMKYTGAPTAEFLSQVLLFDQLDIVAAAAIIGLIAAALSTSDSQIFAMGSELRSLLHGDERQVLVKTKFGIVFFAIAALIFSIISSDQLVMLARVSFAGTSMLGPMVLTGILAKEPPGKIIIFATAAAILIFIGSLLEIVPSDIGGIRMDLLLLVLLTLIAVVSAYRKKYMIEKEKVKIS